MEILTELTQNDLSNLLLFATSSSRAPLRGFTELESNNGIFNIESIPYKYKSQNFIKAHL